MMPQRTPERRYIIERRLVRDRRSALDRRIAERRMHFQWVAFERRVVPARRRGLDRRNPIPRRSWIDRRGSGISWADPLPSSP